MLTVINFIREPKQLVCLQLTANGVDFTRAAPVDVSALGPEAQPLSARVKFLDTFSEYFVQSFLAEIRKSSGEKLLDTLLHPAVGTASRRDSNVQYKAVFCVCINDNSTIPTGWGGS